MPARHPIPTPIFDSLDEVIVTDTSITITDIQLGLDFLKQYAGNKSTFEAYRREMERLLQWSSLIAKKAILELKREDIQHYIEFCLKPPKSWIGLKRTPRFIMRMGKRIPNRAWRPFVASVSKSDHKNGLSPHTQNYQLSQKSVRDIFTVLSSFYQYLLLEDKIAMNPVALVKQKNKYVQKHQQQAPVMRLNEHQWQACLSAVQDNERILFMISMLYLLYLRISELVASDRWTPQMNHFYQDTQGNWWFKTVGKGNKMRDIAVSDDMLNALKRYREYLHLTSLPSPIDKTPLFPKDKDGHAMTSSRHVRRLIQMCFDKAINALREKKLISDADALECATVHWLRHTGISDDINKRHRPIAHVRDDAGHSSSAITDRYNDIDLLDRHDSAKNKKLKTIT